MQPENNFPTKAVGYFGTARMRRKEEVKIWFPVNVNEWTADAVTSWQVGISDAFKFVQENFGKAYYHL